MKSTRQLKVAKTIQAALNDIFMKDKIISLKLLDKPFSVTSISMSKDLKIANCRIRMYTNHSETDSIIDELNTHSKSIRYMLNKRINMKYSPELKFFYDEEMDYQIEVDALCNKVTNDIKFIKQ